MLAFTPSAWTQVIVAISIFGPLIIATVLAIVILRGKRDDPDEQRMRRQQEEYRARRAAEEARSKRR